MGKRVISLLVMVVLVLSIFTACGNTSQNSTSNSTTQSTQGTAKEEANKAGEGGKIRVGVSMASFEFTFVTYLLDGMKEFAKQHPELEVIYQDAKNDSMTQLAQVETMINEKVDSIVLMPVDPKTTKPLVEKCKAAGIKLIGLNRKFEGPDAYVGANSLDAGHILGDLVGQLSKGKGNVGLLQGIMGQESQVVRAQGFKEKLAGYPDVKIAVEGTGEWKREKGMAVVENWLQSSKGINIIAAQNDEMAIGAYKAIEAEGKRDQFIIASIDGTKDGLTYLKQGHIDCTVFQNPYNQGAESLEIAIKFKKGETVEPVTWIPYEPVTKENVDKYLAIYK